MSVSQSVTKSGNLFPELGMPVKSVSVVVCVVGVDSMNDSLMLLSLLCLFEASFASGEIVCF